MKKQIASAPVAAGSRPEQRQFLRWNNVGPALIVAVAAAVSALILLQERQDVAELRTSVREENRLQMQSSLARVEEYFDAVYSTLLFISLDDDVMAMRRDSRHYIQKLCDRQWEQHRLAEVYVVERSFAGGRPPFMTFEHETEKLPLDQIHSLSREQDEYQVQIQHLRRFATNQAIPPQLSREILLCAPDPDGGRSRGFVYSVAIRSGVELVGLVAGMIQTRSVTELLRHGLSRQIALLASERGDLILPPGADPGVERWFRQQFESRGATAFFADAPENFAVQGWRAYWSPAKIVAAPKWWLVYLHPERDYEAQSLLTGWSGHFVIAGSLLGVGLALAFLVRSLNQRLEEQVRHSRERRQLERQVQEVSEREQRRIGENLREDLCQRLTGIEAASQLLKKALAAARLPETQLAEEIAGEIRDLLISARQLADEMQPVALLEHGLVAALEELAARARQRARVACQVEDHGFPAELDPLVATHLYRIAQEAMGNALRHAQAQTILITLAADGGQLTLTVSDDGQGIPEAAEGGPGMGLRIMRYRADLIGAELDIRRAAPRGTAVFARLPRPVRGMETKADSNDGAPL